MTAATPGAHASVPPWRDVRVLRVVAQIAIIGSVVLISYLLWSVLSDNMANSRLTFGFGWLDRTAGFDLAHTPIPYQPTDTFSRAFLVGLLNTLIVSICGIVLATILGVIVGVARLSRNWLVSRITAGYVEAMRNTPLLVQLVLIYALFTQLPVVANSITLGNAIFLNQRGLFVPRPEAAPTFIGWLAIVVAAIALVIIARTIASRGEAEGRGARLVRPLAMLALLVIPIVSWIALDPVDFDLPVLQRFNFAGGASLSPNFAALLLGLVIYTAAFIGEIVRGGIQAVRRGQLEAAYALGLTERQALRLVVFPQALRIIVPPITSQYLNLAKNSSLAIAVGFSDLFSVGRTAANQTGQPVSVIALVMATYLAISLATSLIMNIYNRRIQVLER